MSTFDITPDTSVQTRTVAELVADTILEFTPEIFALMGNGNAYLVDALAADNRARLTALRHEAGTVASADAYYRVSRNIACATTTFGPGFTNALTALGEAACARTPLVLVVGSEPSTGPRPWDVDQVALSQAMGALALTVDAQDPVGSTRQAFTTAVQQRLPVVLNVPYDVATAPGTATPAVESENLTEPARAVLDTEQFSKIGQLLSTAQRPLILAGRGAREAATQLGALADRVGALTTSTAPARGTFAGRRWDLGVCGGFASESSSALIKQADVVLVVGAALNQFTVAFGTQFAADAQLVQIDVTSQATNPQVTHFLQADAHDAVTGLLEHTPQRETTLERWGGVADHARDSSLNFERDMGSGQAPDGLLDPRTAMSRLNEILPANRQVISDGGHFIGWSSYYFDLPAPDSLVMVGTQFQSIGLGLPSATGAALARPDATHVVVTGDGGAIMGLSDLDSLVRTSKSAAVIVFNDGCYGAEIHQYGSQGLDTAIMEIEQVDFVKFGEGFGATGVVVNTLDDLATVETWVQDGANGTLIIDLRISRHVVAPYIEEIVELTLKK